MAFCLLVSVGSFYLTLSLAPNITGDNVCESNECEACGSLHVVLPPLDVKPPQHFDLVQVVVHLPVDEVHLLQQLLLVKLQLTDHFDTSLSAR